MALINCPNCENKISEFAETCPKCKVDIIKLIKEKNNNERIEELQSKLKSQEFKKRKNYITIQKILIELIELLPDSEAIKKELDFVEKQIKIESIKNNLALAKEKYANKKYNETIFYCDQVLSIEPKNNIANDLKNKSINSQIKFKKNILIYTGISISVIIIGIMISLFVQNQQYMSKSYIFLKEEKFNASRQELENCYNFFAFGKNDLKNTIDSTEFIYILSNSDYYIPKPNLDHAQKLAENLSIENATPKLDKLVYIIRKLYFPFEGINQTGKPLYNFNWGITPQDFNNFITNYQMYSEYITHGLDGDKKLLKYLDFDIIKKIQNQMTRNQQDALANEFDKRKMFFNERLKDEYIWNDEKSVYLEFFNNEYYYINISYDLNIISVNELINRFKEMYGKPFNKWSRSDRIYGSYGPPLNFISWFDGNTYIKVSFSIPNEQQKKYKYKENITLLAVNIPILHKSYHAVNKLFISLK